MNTRVKFFSTEGMEDLEKIINKWLLEQPPDTIVNHLILNAGTDTNNLPCFVCMVMYTTLFITTSSSSSSS